MRKIVLLLFTIVLFSSSVFAEQPQLQQKYTLERLILPNFVYSPCHKFQPDRSLLIFFIDERFYNSTGSNIAPTSCKGGSACWSWKIIQPYESLWDIQIFSSELPLKINNLSKLSESIASTIKETQSLRKSSNSLVSAAQEFVNSSFGAGKEKAVTKERSMTQSESRERATELNITPQFHTFLSKAVMGPFVATYPFCVASAVDLFYKAYYSDRSDDLFQAFVIYKNVKPEDIDFSNQSIFLNRAKFLHSLLKQVTDDKDKPRQDAAWAQAVLFAKLLDWKEFEEVRKFVDEQIQKAYQNYQAMTSKTTAEIAQQDKNLAAAKYFVDKELKISDSELKQKQTEIRDEYLKASTFSQIAKASDKDIAELEKAIAKQDPLVTQKFVHHDKAPTYWFLVPLIPGIVVLIFTIFKKNPKKHNIFIFVFTILILSANTVLAFEIDNNTVYFYKNTFQNSVAKINMQLQGLKNEFLAYSHEEPAFQYAYRETRLKIYQNAYGPDFQLSIETGTGQFPQATPGGSKMLFYFAAWKLNQIQITFPNQITHINSFSPDDLNIIYKTIQANNNYIRLVYNFNNKTANITDIKLPALESQISEIISKSKEKSKIYSNFASVQNNFTDTIQKQKHERQSISKNIAVTKNFLVHALDAYLQAIKNENAQTEIMNTFVLGLYHDILINFIKSNNFFIKK